MNDAYMQYESYEHGVTARWHGGEYIELGYVDSDGAFIAGDVINVWDHAANEPRIPRTLDALKDVVDGRLRADERDE